VLEQDSALGGTWARRYDGLHLHTVRARSRPMSVDISSTPCQSQDKIDTT
jgi:cation diffusion facilitator CzcD-associated flavoprotein CzcO